MGLREAIGPGPVALDTAVFIYFIEEHPRYLPIIEPLFVAISEGQLLAATSAITLLEVLVVPYRVGNHRLARRYEMLLTYGLGLRLVGIDNVHLRLAAQLRAAHKLQTPDALQIVAALTSRCSALVTNDRNLPGVQGLRVLQLDDYA